MTGFESLSRGQSKSCEKAAQDPKERDRDAEFQVREVSVDVLEKRLSDTLGYARNTLSNFKIQDLEGSRVSSRDGRTYSVA